MTLTPAKVAFWAWVFIYAGMVSFSIGLFMPGMGLASTLGWLLTLGGAVVTLAGAGLVYLRSRMNEAADSHH